MRILVIQYLSLLMGSVLLTALVYAYDALVAASKLPSPVRDAAESHFPGWRILESDVDRSAAEPLYDVLLRRDRRSARLKVAADGAIRRIRKEATLAEVPWAVEKAVARQRPHARLKRIDAIVRDGATLYRVEFQNAGADRLTFDSRGNVVTEAQNSARLAVASQR